ncbi:4Fe-4S double cluster binding domain-containing protein [Clostridium sp. A1-XYC3]|uniref:4Fe-4S double cluster binding domain-containing protein n=1 Tax=Clostridium tanneri TaxID=3037988 RepID=A0ABU4JUF3_9CLOT|nr:4Fe-4S double cluster binding domain-containing protein [Clostridium sp. A1-XYC3]MDW8801775.1 4Fe-4S double cluster binding domain-containing protein [Clostridium sp. A1-XYC3]
MNLLVEKIKNAALNMGYEKCGIIKISDMSGYEEKLNERIQRIPEVKPYYEGFYRFARLQDTYPWAKSIVICVRQYGKYHIPDHLKGLIGKYYLVDSRRDENSEDFQDSLKFEAYLQEIGLKTAAERKFGITAFRWAALKAGLGLVRRNNFFYTESGSWVHLEAWLIDKELESVEKPTLKECPKNCNLCIKSCPTASLSEPYTMNRLSCISCLTTFEGWDLPNEKFNSQMGSWVFGCDACQDVCPMNKGSWRAAEEFPGLTELSEHISLEKILEMDYTFLEKVMQPKFWYIGKDDVWRWKTNAINAMVNDYKEQYGEYIRCASNDSNEKVREMAQWAIGKLNL